MKNIKNISATEMVIGFGGIIIAMLMGISLIVPSLDLLLIGTGAIMVWFLMLIIGIGIEMVLDERRRRE